MNMSNETIFNLNKNKGMLLEKLLNNSINHYLKNEIAFFTKAHLNIKFKSTTNDRNEKTIKLNSSFIQSKSTVDYYGVYKGQYITFEAKSTDNDRFLFSNIKSHQHKHLLLISKLGGKAFYFIFFKKYSSLFIVNVNEIDYENKKSLTYEEIKKIGKNLEIIFPGIIDFLPLI